MAKSILHIQVGNSITRAQALQVGDGKITPKAYGLCPTPSLTLEEDRTQGIGFAIQQMEERMAEQGASLEPQEILVTLSVGGEPSAVCAGVVKGISGESAKRAALSAGATVTDLICIDDGREDFQRVSDLSRQDISVVVLAGGVDAEIMESGSHQLLSIAKILAQGLPKKHGSQKKVPLIYAASLDAREEVMRIMGDDIEIIWADNVRSRLEEEHLESARNAVVDAFAQSVGLDGRFSGLGRLGSPQVLPSGYAKGMGVERLYSESKENVLGFSLDGDSVQVFSYIGGVFTRTVTSIDAVDSRKVAKWLPTPSLTGNLEEMLANLRLHPWIVPAGWDELAVYLAFWKEVIREGIAEHKESAIELRGIQRPRKIDETFEVRVSGGDTILKAHDIRKVVVTGVLSHILSERALLSLIMDGANLSGVTAIYRDPWDVLPVVGSLSPGNVSIEDHLKSLGVLVGPGQDRDRVGTRWVFSGTGSSLEPLPVRPNEIVPVDLNGGGEIDIVLEPSRTEDLGNGKGHKVWARVASGFTQVYLDGRPRTMIRSVERIAAQDILKWYGNLGVFPQEVLSAWSGGRA
ncbi:MAG: glutamate mutase L [Bacillota bacterium]